MSKPLLTLLAALLAVGCGDEDDQVDADDFDSAPIKLSPPALPPLPPIIPRIARADIRPSAGVTTPVARSDPTQVPPAEPDPLIKSQQVYREFASLVARIERETIHIPSRATKHRSRFYWKPLNEGSDRLRARFRIGGPELAGLIERGLSQSWPTIESSDGPSVARMLRRIKTERIVRQRRLVADVDRAILDALTDMIVSEASAAGTAANHGNAAIGSMTILPPGLRPGTGTAPLTSTIATCPLSHSHGSACR